MERLITEEAHNRNRKGASKQARAVLVKIGPQSDVIFCFQVNGPITRGEGWGGGCYKLQFTVWFTVISPLTKSPLRSRLATNE